MTASLWMYEIHFTISVHGGVVYSISSDYDKDVASYKSDILKILEKEDFEVDNLCINVCNYEMNFVEYIEQFINIFPNIFHISVGINKKKMSDDQLLKLVSCSKIKMDIYDNDFL